MYRNSKKKLAKRTSLSALMALGALATGAGIAGAATHTTAHSTIGSAGTATVQPIDRHGRGDGGVPGVARGQGGVVTNVATSSITVVSPSGASSTYTIDASTKVYKGRSVATVADLAVGERVGIMTSATGATSAAVIEIQLAHIGGQVVSVNGNSITVADRDGFYRTITVSAGTTYAKSGAAASLQDVTTGSFIMAEGTVDANHTTLDASTIGIGTPPQNGATPGQAPGAMGPEGMGGPGMGPQGSAGMF